MRTTDHRGGAAAEGTWSLARRVRPRRQRSWAAALALASVGLLFAGCGSRLPESTIAQAAHKPIYQGSATSSGSGVTGGTGAQALGGSAPCSSTTTTTSGAKSTTTTAESKGGATTTSSTTTTTAPCSPAALASGATGGGSGHSGGAASGTPGAGSQPARTAASSAPAAGGGGGATSNSTIALGNVGTYSGVIGAVFSGAQQTIGVWQAYVNAHGGLNGHPVHVYIEDDGADPSTSVSDVEQEVTQDHVIAFVGNLMPLTVQASVAYLQQQNIPVIGGDASSNAWWQNSMLFPQASSALGTDEADFTIKAAAAKGYSKMALLYCVEDPTCSNNVNQIISSTQAYGVQTVYSSSFSITQPDFTAQCLDAKQAGATFVYFAGDGDSLLRMSNNCAAQNYNPLYVGDSIAITANLATDPHLNGLLAGQTNFPWIDSFTAAQATYQQAVKQYDPTLAGSATTSAEWSAGMLALAASKDLTASPTSAEFLQGLWSIKNDNLGGLAPPLSFNQNAPATPSNCYFLMTLQNGQFVDLQNGATQCVS